MASLVIPTTRGTLPTQNAVEPQDPSRFFGQRRADPINMPNVPQGMGGIQVDESGAGRALERGVNQISSVAERIATDINEKEKALSFANESMTFEKNKIEYHNKALEAQQTASTLLRSGDLKDHEDAKGYYDEKIRLLNDEYFGEGKFKDERVSNHAKLFGMKAAGTYADSFKENVIIPSQTRQYLETHNAISSARTVQALNDGLVVPLDRVGSSISDGLKKIDEQYSNPAIFALMKPEEIERRKQADKLNFMQNYMTGMSERGIDFNDSKRDPLTVLEKQIANQQNIKKLIMGDSEIAAAYGPKLDDAIRGLDGSIVTKQNQITAERDRRERKAIAAAERAERQAIAAAKADVALYGPESKFMQTIDRQPAVVRAAVIDGMETYDRREKTTVGQAMTFGKTYAGRQDSLNNPTKEDRDMVDSDWKLNKNVIMKSENPTAEMANRYWKTGVVPSEQKDFVSHKLNSSDPKDVQAGLDLLRQIDNSNGSAVASAWTKDPYVKVMLANYKSGVSVEQLIKTRDKNREQLSIKKPEEINRTAYDASGAKNEIEFKKKITSEVSSVSGKSVFGGEWSERKVDERFLDDISESTKSYINSGMKYKDAVKQAYTDASLTGGGTSLQGEGVKVVRFSPERMTGRTGRDIRKELNKDIDELKTRYPELSPHENDKFILIPSRERTSAGSPIFEIWFQNEYGQHVQIRNPDTYKPIYFNASRKGK